jgi:hypothetical protein
MPSNQEEFDTRPKNQQLTIQTKRDAEERCTKARQHEEIWGKTGKKG